MVLKNFPKMTCLRKNLFFISHVRFCFKLGLIKFILRLRGTLFMDHYYRWFSKGLLQWLLAPVHCLSYISYIQHSENWMCSCLHVTGCHYTDSCFIRGSSWDQPWNLLNTRPVHTLLWISLLPWVHIGNVMVCENGWFIMSNISIVRTTNILVPPQWSSG
jgi:hypothetical protein